MPRFHLAVSVSVAVVLLFTASVPRSSASTTIPGGNIVNQTWTSSGSPYIVQGDIAVPSGAVLTIDAGTVVLFASSDGQVGGTDPARIEVTVKGSLQVDGTAASPVSMQAQSGTSAGIWVGILVDAAATGAALHHLLLEHSTQGVWNAAPTGILSLDEVTLAINGYDLVQTPTAGDPAITGTLTAGRFSGNLQIPTGATLALDRALSQVSGGNFTLASGATYRPILSSAASYQQLQVLGGASLAGTLDLDVASLTASVGQTFTLIDDDGTDAVSGTFGGLAEGAQFDAGSYRFQITYMGGTGNDVVLTVVANVPTCDLSVRKTAPGEVPLSGGGLDYAITVSNSGSGTAQGAVVVDSLPAGLRYSSAVPSQGTCAVSGGRITCSLGDIPPADSATVAIHASFDFDTLIVVNTAAVTAQNPDVDLANNTVSTVTDVIPSTTAVPEPAAAPFGPGLRVQPNPSRRTARVSFRADPGSRAELEIFDPAGRRVRRLVATVDTPGATAIEWDGRDDAGTPVGSGVFYYRVRVNGRVIGAERSVLVH